MYIRMICKKDLVSFLSPHRTYVFLFVRIASVSRGHSNKYPKHMLLEVLNNNATAQFLINCHLSREGLRASQIVSITNLPLYRVSV